MTEIEKKKLQHEHLIDGKYLKEDCIPSLRQEIEAHLFDCIPSILHATVEQHLDRAFRQFEHECACYDRSKQYQEILIQHPFARRDRDTLDFEVQRNNI